MPENIIINTEPSRIEVTLNSDGVPASVVVDSNKLIVRENGVFKGLVNALEFENGNNTVVSVIKSGSKATVKVDASGGGGGSGTVSSFSAGNLSPLFTSSVADETTTPSLTFAQVNQSANLVFAGPTTGAAAAAPTFRSLVAADIPALPYWPLAGSAVLTNDFDITLNGTNTHNFKANDTAIQFRSVVTGFNEYSNIYSGGTNALISRFNSVGPVFNYMNVSDAGVDFVTNALSFTIGGSPGTNGQVLTSNGTNATWATPAVGGSSVFSDLIAATGTNTINNAGYAQEWQWNSLAGASGLRLSSTSTAAASNTQRLFSALLSGANSTSSQTTTSGYFSNTHTGTSSINVGVYTTASGGTTNVALHADGNTFIGGYSTPQGRLHIKGTTADGSANTIYATGSTGTLLLRLNNRGNFYHSPQAYNIGNGSVASFYITQSLTNTAGANENIMLTVRPTYNLTAGTPTVIGYDYNPTETSLTGTTHYAFRSTSSTAAMLLGGTTLTTNAILDLQSTTKAFIPPRMTTTQRDAIGTPSAGMVIYNTTTGVLNFHNGSAWGAV